MSSHSPSNPASTSTSTTHQEQLSTLLKALILDPLGIVDIGTDGILRSFSATNTILSAHPLSPQLIKALLDRGPYKAHIEERFRGVDGMKTPQDEWFHPRADVELPRLRSEEEIEAGRRELEANRERIEEWKKRKAAGEVKGCGTAVRSNYDLGLRG